MISVKNAYTKEQLITQLKNAGIKSTDSVMVHSSMKSLGMVEGGADTVVDSLMEYFSDGLLMMPTHTWKQMSTDYNIFNPNTEPACVGIIPNIFLKKSGVVRSLHPTHSIAAYGNTATDYIKGEELVSTPCPPNGCWGRLLDINAKILLIGVTHARNTFIHSIEEMFDVPERFTASPVPFEIVMPDNSLKKVNMYRHYNIHAPHISENFDKMLQGYFDTNAAKKIRLGDAECILCDAARLYEITGRILKQNINCFIECNEISSEWYTD